MKPRIEPDPRHIAARVAAITIRRPEPTAATSSGAAAHPARAREPAPTTRKAQGLQVEAADHARPGPARAASQGGCQSSSGQNPQQHGVDVKQVLGWGPLCHSPQVDRLSQSAPRALKAV